MNALLRFVRLSVSNNWKHVGGAGLGSERSGSRETAGFITGFSSSACHK